MDNLGLNILARFPFINEATDYIKHLNLSIDNILESIAYRSAWLRGKNRVIEAIEMGEIKDHGASTEAEYINELLSYVIARIITSTIADKFLVRRYAMAESVYAYNGLKDRDLKFLSDVAGQFNLTPVEIVEDGLEIRISDYLKYSTLIRAPEYKLVNRDVFNGLVKVSIKELARLLQEALRKKINDDLPIDLDNKLKKKLLPKLNEITNLVQTRKKQFEVKDLGKVSIIRFPPCMKQLLGMTQAGENVPHVGRFAIATFLHHIGLSSDQILNLFSSSPDFDVGKARYQVEHVTGKISGTEYSPPACDTMISNGICFNPDSLCNKSWLTHPLKYYKVKRKRRTTVTKKKNQSKENNTEQNGESRKNTEDVKNADNSNKSKRSDQ